MNRNVLAIFILLLIMNTTAYSSNQTRKDVKVNAIAINGGADTVNPGTSCIKITASIPAVCKGYIAIKNNNKLLLSAALTAKTTGSSTWIYFEDNDGSLHCPGRTYTSCSLISIEVK